MVSFKKIKSFALISVFDKTNLGFLCNLLQKNKIGIISTGSTSKKIRSLGYNCFEISELTKFNEVLDGRVKTLHPNIYISILHNRANHDHKKTFNKINFPRIDYVIVNLYPFTAYIDNNNINDSIEMIDIGGPTLIRASAKNYNSVTTICSPKDYESLKNNLKKNLGSTDYNFRKKMAQKTFSLTSEYDNDIYRWLSNKKKSADIKLRYGENPNQNAFLKIKKNLNLSDFQLQGKELGYNNILDIESGLDFIGEFTEPTTVIIKHNNACGVASSKTIRSSFLKALRSDKKSAFGGVVLVNKKIGESFAKVFVKDFYEVLVSPSFSKEATDILSKKKNLILINSKTLPKKTQKIISSVRMGSLIQQNNDFRLSKKHFKIVSSKTKISKREYQDIIFAFKVVKHTKSNAIVLVKNKQTVGIGAGQMNRYDATKIAVMKYKENFSTKDLVCASDAFFPFTDSLNLLKNNCSCIVSPSGSINDQKIIDFANKHNVKLIFSSVRVFKH